ncbi:MAG: hypothetical protein KatS3mg104_2959 [Phycisphaerae bacterium]|nr:MAG: hypothetical protein KatS3mg104_2959 [Phycisphaerae bacterium]
MIEIFKKLNPSVKYVLDGEFSGELSTKTFIVPGLKTDLKSGSVKASSYTTGGVRKFMTPSFFESYTDPFGDPFIVQFYDEDSNKVGAGIIDPDSVVYDYATRETSFNVVSPLWLLGKKEGLEGRDVLKIKPLGFEYRETGGEIFPVFKLNNESRTDAWVVGDYIESSIGIGKIHAKQYEDDFILYFVEGNVGRSISVPGTVNLVYRQGGVITSVDVILEPTTISFYSVDLNRQFFAALVIGSNSYACRAAVSFSGNVLGGFAFRGHFTFVADSPSSLASGTAVTANFFLLNDTEDDSEGGLTDIMFISRQYFNTNMTSNEGESVDKFLKELLPNVSPIFSPGSITYSASSGDAVLKVHPAAVPPTNAMEAFEALLAAAAAKALVTWTDGEQPVTVITTPLTHSSGTPVDIGVNVKSLTRTVPNIRRDGVTISYKGDNLTKNHKGWFPSYLTSAPDSSDTIKISACYPAASVTKTDRGDFLSPDLTEISRIYHEFYTAFLSDWEAEVYYGSVEPLTGSLVDISVESVDADTGDASFSTVTFFVVSDSVDPKNGTHKLKLWSTSNPPPAPSKLAYIVGSPLLFRDGSITYTLYANSGDESVDQVTWRVWSAAAGGSLLHSQVKTTGYETFSISGDDGPYNPYARIWVEAEVRFTPSMTTVTTDRFMTFLITPTSGFTYTAPLKGRINTIAGIIESGDIGGRFSTGVDGRETIFGQIDASVVRTPYAYESAVVNKDFEDAPDLNGWSVTTINNGVAEIITDGAYGKILQLRVPASGNPVVSGVLVEQTVTYTNGIPGELCSAFIINDPTDILTTNNNYSTYGYIRITDSSDTTLAEVVWGDIVLYLWGGYGKDLLQFNLPADKTVKYKFYMEIQEDTIATSNAVWKFSLVDDRIITDRNVYITQYGVEVGTQYGKTSFTVDESVFRGLASFVFGGMYVSDDINFDVDSLLELGSGVLYLKNGKLYFRYKKLDGTFTTKEVMMV